jgi:hypothetical protein
VRELGAAAASSLSSSTRRRRSALGRRLRRALRGKPDGYARGDDKSCGQTNPKSHSGYLIVSMLN